MIEFKSPELSDRSWIEPILRESGFRGNEYAFATMYMWGKPYHIQVARYGDFLLVKTKGEGRHSYLYPAGTGDIGEVVKLLIADSKEQGAKFEMYGLTAETKAILEEALPDTFDFTTDRDFSDYVYNVEDLAELRGKKYHGKRNHIAKFEKNFPEWQYEDITKENIEDCFAMNTKWCELNGCMKDPGLKKEYCAVKAGFENFFELGLIGGLIRNENGVVAYTMGERIGKDTLLVHFEKAFYDVQGSYPIINREFVRHHASDLLYVNREDDTGDEGLRKAKLSYHPAFLLEKYQAVLKGDVAL